MAERELSDEEAEALGLASPRERELSDDEAISMGLEPPRPGPSKAQSFGRGVVQGGTLGFGDEIAGSIQGALQEIGNAVPQGALRRLGIENYEGGRDNPDDVYRDARDHAQSLDEAAKAANPKTYLAGEVGGGLVLPVPAAAPLTAGKIPLKVLMAHLAKQGAVTGAAYGLGSSKADLTTGDPREYARAGLDTAIGGTAGVVGGAAVAPVAHLAGRGLSAVAGRVGSGLDDFSARRALKAAGYIQKDLKKDIANEGIERVLQRGRDLRDTGAVRAFSSVDDVASRASDLVDEQGQRIGNLLSETDARAVSTDLPSGSRVAERIRREILPGVENSPSLADLGPAIENRASMYGQHEQGVPLTELNQWKSDLSSRLKWGADPSLPEQYNRQMRGILKDEVNTAVGEIAPDLAPELATANRLYGSLKPTAKRANEGMARDLGNRMASPSDYGAAIAGVAAAGPAGVALGAVNKVVRKYGSSTASVAAGGAANKMAQLKAALQTNPEALGKFAAPLAAASRRGDEKLAVVNFMLSQVYPEYRQKQDELALGDDAEH